MGLAQDPGTPLNSVIFSKVLNQTLCLFKIVHKDVLVDKQYAERLAEMRINTKHPTDQKAP